MTFMFEKLEVYQKAVAIADCIAALGFPRGFGFLVDQLNRAALSIARFHAPTNQINFFRKCLCGRRVPARKLEVTLHPSAWIVDPTATFATP